MIAANSTVEDIFEMFLLPVGEDLVVKRKDNVEMSKVTLLTAEPRAGKTTCIKQIINQVGAEHFEGFFTEEIRENGERTGFVCVSLTGEKAMLATIHSTSSLRVSRYGVELNDFETLVIPIIEKALSTNKILVIDEIGPMELFSDKFKTVLTLALNSQKIIIGTIYLKPHPEVDEFKKYSTINLLLLTSQNRDTLPSDMAKKLMILKNDN